MAKRWKETVLAALGAAAFMAVVWAYIAMLFPLFEG